MRGLHDLVREQASRTPDAVAVEAHGRRWTYSALETFARRLAAELHRRGVAPGDRVAVCAPRAPWAIGAWLAALKAGAAFVPIDPDLPPARRRRILQDVEPAALIQETKDSESDRDVAVVLDPHRLPARRDTSGETRDPLFSVEQPAYILYTSGSTGAPKGAVVTHRSIVNYLRCMRRRFRLEEEDHWLCVSSLAFDAALADLFLPLTSGARAILASREEMGDSGLLRDRLAMSRPRFLAATPTVWSLLLVEKHLPESFADLTAISGGEALPRSLADELLMRCSAVHNHYGPTETTIDAAIWQVQPGTGAIPIGRPTAGAYFCVVDRRGRPASIGELLIGGVGVAQSYWKRPSRTALQFVPDPLAGTGPVPAGARLYRTGDLVRRREDGALEFLGRIDDQVKVRGFRVELGEIETALLRLPSIRAAVVGVDGDRLVAWLQKQESTSDGISTWRRSLAETLPNYMIPSLWVEVDRFPRTSNGKIDRRRLPDPAVLTAAVETTAPEDPQDALTRRQNWLASALKKLLRTEDVETGDNFFDLGATSVQIGLFTAWLREELGEKRIHATMLIRHPTIDRLGEFLANRYPAAMRKRGY